MVPASAAGSGGLDAQDLGFWWLVGIFLLEIQGEIYFPLERKLWGISWSLIHLPLPGLACPCLPS